jgi:hypothetical protein
MRRNLLFLLALTVPAAGCVAAAAAGAAGGVYLTTRGAESVIAAPVDEVAGRAESVMTDLAIVKDGESTEAAGDKHVLKGKKGDLDITIAIEAENDSTSKVEVTARENLAEWDKDYAKEVLNQIVQKS